MLDKRFNGIFVLQFLLCNLWVSSLLVLNTSPNINAIFGAKGLGFKEPELAKVESLTQELTRLSKSHQIEVAQKVIKLLEKDLSSVKTYQAKLQEENQIIPESVFYKEFLLKHQISYLTALVQYGQKEDVSWYETGYKLARSLMDASSQNASDINISKIAQSVYEFIRFEREEILSDYKKTLHYFRLLTDYQLPYSINFWHTQDIQERVKRRTKKITSTLRVQWVEALASLFVQSIVLAGGTLATQWEDDTDKKAFDQAQTVQSKITSDWQTFQTQLLDQQKNIITKITTTYTDSQKKLNQQYDAANNLLQAEIMYLNRSINLNQPIRYALDSWVQWDQFFEYSVMATPKKYPWYNIYHYNNGDWQFDPISNSFWQNSVVPFAQPTLWQKLQQNKDDQKSVSIFNDDPAANSIFTEYITGANSYSIQIECTIINASYPFFVGIMVNRGRWISGDPERIWQYRLFGLYGYQSNPNDPSTKTIDACLAQQILNKKALPTSPLEQIMSNQQTHLYTLPKQEISLLKTNPITYVLTVVTQPTNVICTISKKEISTEGSEITTQLFTGPVSNLDPYAFIFGGIGFMAVGAQATFSVKQPIDLMYTPGQLRVFNQQRASAAKISTGQK